MQLWRDHPIPQKPRHWRGLAGSFVILPAASCVSPHLCPSRACLEWVPHYAPVCQCLSGVSPLSARVKAGLLGLPASSGLQKDLSQIPSPYAVTLATAKGSYCLLTTNRPIEIPPSIPFPTHRPLKPGPIVAHMAALYPDSPSSLTSPNEHMLEASRQQTWQVLGAQVCDLSYMDVEA